MPVDAKGALNDPRHLKRVIGNEPRCAGARGDAFDPLTQEMDVLDRPGLDARDPAASQRARTHRPGRASLGGTRGYRPWMAADTPVVWMPGGVRTEIHLAAQDTGGAFCLLVDHLPTGWSLPAHRHHNEAETIHIIEGDFEMEIDGQRSRLCRGETIHIPRGAIHSSANIGPRPGSCISCRTSGPPTAVIKIARIHPSGPPRTSRHDTGALS